MPTPIPYQLDILGGLPFENLIQELLIADLGLGVEAWGGSADHGKDAYCDSELNFPNRHVTNTGPFVFQCKFVAGANATGAKFENELMGAVRKETELIKKRIEKKQWEIPEHYALFTNAPVTAGQREKVKALLNQALPKTTITTQGATAICGLLDANITVARAFPQLLSLRDLTELLRTVVHNRSIQRSKSVIREAEILTKVYVPTGSYSQAWQVLAKHNFVVLEGPPEMGKTAIAWMISAVKLTEKWEAIDCDDPDDFFDGYSGSRKQVFVADDAFGTTEYETVRGSKWGRQLHKILPSLNSTHWLIWTSRMHILNKALQEMSLQGQAAKFPKPAEIIVNASRINRRERALILYRHVRAMGLEEGAKNIIRQNIASLIDNTHFTPERIRRFVNEELPDLSKKVIDGELSVKDVPELVEKAIENPTDRMKKSYSKLETKHKWLLIALLDCDRNPQSAQLEIAYHRFVSAREPIDEEIQLLEEGFLQKTLQSKGAVIDWIHPSYRDLVIQELASDEESAQLFLDKCSIHGIQLAISVAGGASGKNQFPLMSNKKHWETLRRRSVTLIRESGKDFTVWQVLATLRNAIDSASHLSAEHDVLASILNDCCVAAKDRLDELGEPVLLPANLDSQGLVF